jgi:hypothetical protein
MMVASIVALGTVASAQVAPAPSGVQPTVTSEYHPTGYPESYIGVGRSLYPGTELRALPAARAQAVAARANLQRAESDLNMAVSNVKRTFRRSEELNQALAEEKAAWDDLTAARDAVLADLKKDPNYQAAVALKDRLSTQIRVTREEQPKTPAEQLVAMASVKLNFAATATAMEVAAINADPTVRAARERLVAAGARLSKLRQDFDDAAHADPQVLAARKSVQDARIAAVAADAMYIEATRVADAALDYAYFMQAHPIPYSVNDIYGGYGYYGAPSTIGYPIGYPYGWGR